MHQRPEAAEVFGSLAVIAVLGIAAILVRRAAARVVRLVRLHRLAAEIAAGRTESLEQGLRRAVGDESLRVAYPCADGTLVRADGERYRRAT